MAKDTGIAEQIGSESTALKAETRPGVWKSWRYVLLGGINMTLFGVVTVLILASRDDSDEIVGDRTAPIDVMQTVAKADALQFTGKPEAAMELYQLVANTPSGAAPSLSYRLGVCAEQLGEFDTAIEHYKSADARTIDEASCAAQLGQARIHYRKGNFASSKKILSSMAAASAMPAYTSGRLGADVDYLMALVHCVSVLGELPESQFTAGHVFSSPIPFAVEDVLALVPMQNKQLNVGRPAGDDAHAGVQIHGVARNPWTTLLSAGFHNRPISELLDSLAATTSWKLALTEVATEIVSAKRVDVYLHDKTAAEFLSLVLEPQELNWNFEGDTLVIDQAVNARPEDVSAQQRKRANELLLSALSDDPDHAMSPQAYLALGNLAVLEGRGERAATFYKEVIERYQHHDISQTATFNLAKIFYSDSDLAAAKESLYLVVDKRQGTELEPLAYLFLGRIHFDQGNLKKAKTDLSRSLALAPQPELAAMASLTLAAAYLVQRGPGSAGSANSVMMDNRQSLQAEAFRTTAVFLSALTRFRAAFTPGDVRRRGRELMAAAIKVDPDQFFGDFGYVLVGDAFADLNVTSETVRLYQEGLSRPLAVSMRDQLMFRLSAEYRKQNEYQLAKKTLRELTETTAITWASTAAVELADLLLQLREHDECMKHCRRSLGRGYADDKNVELLRILGRIYEELGHHEHAGLCFAGFLPSLPHELAEVGR